MLEHVIEERRVQSEYGFMQTEQRFVAGLLTD
jgi:hypothetical protein